MPTSYSWELVPTPEASGNLPDPGPATVGTPQGNDPRKNQFVRGIKFGNVPGGKADNVIHGGARVYHVNSVANLVQSSSDKMDFSGVVKFRNIRNRAVYKPPSVVNVLDPKYLDQFGNTIFPFTGPLSGSGS